MATATRYEQQLAALAVAVAADVPLLLWGPPGQGKTAVLTQLAAVQQRSIEVVIASLREPSDFAGLPVVDERGGVALAPPAWARRLTQAEQPGIVFFDELTTAPPSVQAALLRVVADRVVGELSLPPGTSIVAAANEEDVAADGWALSAPAANRFCHLDWSLPPAVVADGLSGHWPDVPALELSGVAGATVQARSALSAFLRARPVLATAMPPAGPQRSRGFPTPRSWSLLADLLAVAWAAGVGKPVVSTLAQGTVGDAAAHELVRYLAELDLPDAEELLARAAVIELPSSQDKAYAYLTAVVLAVEGDPTPTRWEAAGVLVARVAASGRSDIAAPFAERWAKCRPEGAVMPEQLAPSLRRTLELAGRVPSR